MKSRNLTVVVLVMAVAVAASAADLKIGILAPLSGPVPGFGTSMRAGALFAIQEWNDKGGVLGRLIVPVVEDGQCDGGPAAAAARKLIDEEGVRYIVGEVCSAASIPVSDIANAARVVEISPTSTHPLYTVDAAGKTKPYIFRACFIDPFQGSVAAHFAYGKLKARKAFILRDPSNGYVNGLAQAFGDSFGELGGRAVGNETYSGSDNDFAAMLQKVKDSQPDVVFLPDFYNVVNVIVRQARQMGISAAFMGGDGWESPDLDRTAAAGSYYVNHFASADPRPHVQTFLKAYAAFCRDRLGSVRAPDAIAALAYDATNLVLAGIKAAGSDDTDKVRSALEKITFDGVSGQIRFDSHHDPLKQAVIMRVTPEALQFETTVLP